MGNALTQDAYGAPPDLLWSLTWMLMIEENIEGNMIEDIDDAEEFRD